jgi:hypothetical protein
MHTLNKCTVSGTRPVIKSVTGQDGEIKHRIECPATGQMTDWASNIPDAVDAWNAAHPEPPPAIPTIPLIPKPDAQ